MHASNPFDFMRFEHDPIRLAAFQRQDIVIAIGRGDPHYQQNEDFSAVLWEKGIGNALRVFDGHAHDWPYWEDWLVRYVAGHD